MRLIPVCLPLVLAPLLIAGQQAQTPATQKTQQTSAAKQTSAQHPHGATARHKARHHSRRAAARRGSKHPQRRAEYTGTPVDVITGGETRHVVLENEKTSSSGAKTASGQTKVQVINGSATNTQYFSRDEETAHNQPVVVGVQSSETRYAGGNKNPVVTGVTSSSSNDARTAGTGGQPVAKQVSPHPKRPAYQPDTH